MFPKGQVSGVFTTLIVKKSLGTGFQRPIHLFFTVDRNLVPNLKRHLQLLFGNFGQKTSLSPGGRGGGQLPLLRFKKIVE